MQFIFSMCAGTLESTEKEREGGERGRGRGGERERLGCKRDSDKLS